MCRRPLVRLGLPLGLVLGLTPLLVVLAVQLPGDWRHHVGRDLPGTARVTAIEEGKARVVLVDVVDVVDEHDRTVATRLEVAGEVPARMGASFPVRYLPGEDGMTQVYSAGHDPFGINAGVLAGAAAVWLISASGVARGLRRRAAPGASRRADRKNRASDGSYRVAPRRDPRH